MAILLLVVVWGFGVGAIPGSADPIHKVFEIKAEPKVSLVEKCIATPDGELLFGTLARLHIGNPYVGRLPALTGRTILYQTGQGQTITLTPERGATLVRVRGAHPLSAAQEQFLNNCSRGLASW